MNIAVLSRGESLYSTKSLINAGASMGHVMEVLDPTYCNLTIENGKSIVRFNNEIIDDLHAIIPRIGASNTYFGASLVRHFEQQGVFSVASANGILQSRDKWTCTQILSQGGIPTPNTMLGITANMEVLLENISSFPIIIKILEGTHGQGADIRVIVVDNVVVGAMKRQSKAGDFRSNLHRGGSSQKITLSHQEELVALKTAKVLGLKVCGVDILQSQKGPLVLEVNSTPGLEGIQTTTGVDIAKKIISLIERNKK